MKEHFYDVDFFYENKSDTILSLKKLISNFIETSPVALDLELSDDILVYSSHMRLIHIKDVKLWPNIRNLP